MNGIIADENTCIVLVYTNQKGQKITEFLRLHGHKSFELNLFGAFLYNKKVKTQRMRPTRAGWEGDTYFKKYPKVLGCPEGGRVCLDRNGCGVFVISNYPCDIIVDMRAEYKRKLTKIKEKAHELMGMGIDRKTAFRAAVKCECSK